jgi:RNA polymerase sigma factor (sigma-70 family)
MTRKFSNKSKAIAIPLETSMVEAQNNEIGNELLRQRNKLLSFIQKRVPDRDEAEDILQDVFYQFIESYRLMKPVEQAGAWLYRVARNRITDRFRKKKPERFSTLAGGRDENDEPLMLADLLPTDLDSPETKIMNEMLMEELTDALEQLPKAQKEIFIQHEVEGKSFAEISKETGESINTLLSRKRYAIIFLREKLKNVYTEFMN